MVRSNHFSSLLKSLNTIAFIYFSGKPNNPTLLNAKWESLALVPVNDANAPNDYFLITVVCPYVLLLYRHTYWYHKVRQ